MWEYWLIEPQRKTEVEKMKGKILGICVVAIMVMAGLSGIAMARGPKGPTHQAGNSPIEHIYLYQKTGRPDWEIVEDGAWGKMMYNTDTGKFVFNGHHLIPDGAEYTLINFARNYPEWPATINILGSGVTNETGDIHIEGTFVYEDLEYDDTPDEGGEDYGYKIWLVPSGEINDAEMLAGWNWEQYLFEEKGFDPAEE